MQSPLAAAHSTIPKISLVLRDNGEPSNSRIVENLAFTSKRLKLATTWIISEPRQAKLLANQSPETEVAATVKARSPQRLRSELSNLQAGIESLTGQNVRAVAGDPQQLRARAALLADLGVTAIVSEAQAEDSAKPPRQLPCGLWQLDPSIALPRARSRWSLVPSRRPTIKRLLEGGAATGTILSIDLATAAPRDMQLFDRLMQEAAEASRQQFLSVVTISELATSLTHQHEVKPQRSILRRAA